MASPVLGTIRPMWWFQLQLRQPQQLMQPQFRQCHLHHSEVGDEADRGDFHLQYHMEQSIQLSRRQEIAGFVAIGRI